MRSAALIIALTVAISALAGEPPAVFLRVNPHVMFPRQALFIEAHVQPHAENRWLLIEAEGDLSEWSMEGEKAPTVYRRRWIAGEPGEYLIHVRVLDGRKQLRAYAQQRIVVSE